MSRSSLIHLYTVAVFLVGGVLFGHGWTRVGKPWVASPIPFVDLVSPPARPPGMAGVLATLGNARGLGGFGSYQRLPEKYRWTPAALVGTLWLVALGLQVQLILARRATPERLRDQLMTRMRYLTRMKSWEFLVEAARNLEHRHGTILSPGERMESRCMAAEAYANLGKPQRALELYRDVISRDSQHPEARSAVTRLLIELKEGIPSEWQGTVMGHILDVTPLDRDAVGLIVADIIGRAQPEKRSIEHVDKVLAGLKKRDEATAVVVEALRGHIDDDQNPLIARLVLAQLHRSREDWRLASDQLFRALMVDSSVDVVHDMLWHMHTDLGGARAVLDQYKAYQAKMAPGPELDKALGRLTRACGPEASSPRPPPPPPPPGPPTPAIVPPASGPATASGGPVPGMRATPVGGVRGLKLSAVPAPGIGPPIGAVAGSAPTSGLIHGINAVHPAGAPLGAGVPGAGASPQSVGGPPSMAPASSPPAGGFSSPALPDPPVGPGAEDVSLSGMRRSIRGLGPGTPAAGQTAPVVPPPKVSGAPAPMAARSPAQAPSAMDSLLDGNPSVSESAGGSHSAIDDLLNGNRVQEPPRARPAAARPPARPPVPPVPPPAPVVESAISETRIEDLLAFDETDPGAKSSHGRPAPGAHQGVGSGPRTASDSSNISPLSVVTSAHQRAEPSSAGLLESAIAMLERGQTEQAVAQLQTVIRLGGPFQARARAYLATAFLDLGHSDLARNELDQLARTSLGDAELYLLASKCEQKGLAGRSGEYLRRLYAQNISYKDVKDRMARLQAGDEPDDVSFLTTSLPPRYADPVVIGRGGMGVVFRVRDKDLDRTVALKVLGPNLIGNTSVEQRFFAEARTLARLRNPGIIEIYDISKTGIPFFAMEFLRGETLSTLSRLRKLKLRQALRHMQDVLVVLDYCHREGVIHRDIKPENIFVTEKGETKVVDFGLARQQEGPGLTRPGMAMGSPYYMSPEQILGTAVDQRTDIYAVGVCLFFLCTGRMPYKSEMDSLKLDPARLRQVNDQLPQALDDIVDRCMRRHRDERPSSCTEIIAQLSPFVK